MFFGQDRHALRQIYFRAWHKHTIGETLEGAEQLIVAVALRHPEYHALLSHPEAGEDRDWLPESGEANPFLHMGLHIAIEEQLAINQPPDIRLRYARLCQRHGDEHVAQHAMMECLGEMMWRAGRENRQPDWQVYLDCLARELVDLKKNS
jgi:Domain of unknown function (DUF1841)